MLRSVLNEFCYDIHGYSGIYIFIYNLSISMHLRIFFMVLEMSVYLALVDFLLELIGIVILVILIIFCQYIFNCIYNSSLLVSVTLYSQQIIYLVVQTTLVSFIGISTSLWYLCFFVFDRSLLTNLSIRARYMGRDINPISKEHNDIHD